MSDQEFDVAAFAAQATGTSGISDDAGYDQAQQPAPSADPSRDAEMQAMAQHMVALHQQNQQLQAYQQQVQAFLAQQQQAQLEAQIPAFEDDPEGHLNAVKAQMANELGQMRDQLETQQRVAQFSAQLQQDVAAVAPTVTQAEDELRAEVGSHYDEAYSFVHQSIQQQLAQKYPGADPQTLVTVEKAASIQFVRDCAARGESPARAIWNFAQQLGFVPSGQRVPGQERKAPPTSLSNIPAAGRAPDQRGRLTARDIATMPQDEFDAMFESMRKSSVPMPI